MGWLRLVGSSKLYVSFAKKPYKREYILQRLERDITYDSFHWKCYTSEFHQVERKSDSLVFRGTNLNWGFGWIWICTKKFEFYDFVDVERCGAFSVESVIHVYLYTYKYTIIQTYQSGGHTNMEVVLHRLTEGYLHTHMRGYKQIYKSRGVSATTGKGIYTYTCVCKHTHIHRWECTGWWRCLGCLIFVGHFLQKSPVISGSFATRDLQGILCILATLYLQRLDEGYACTHLYV